MANYWLQTHLKDGTFCSKIPFRNLQFEVGYNGPSGIRWESPLYHTLMTPTNLSPGLHEVRVMRNGICTAAGPIWDMTVSTDSQSMTCSAQSLEDYLDVRLLRDVSYATQDQTAIAWNMISTTQAYPNGDLGIVLGTVGTGVTRSIDFKTYDNKYILEAIQDFAEMEDGFDFWIDPATRAFNAIYPRPQVDRGLHLVYPQHISSYAVTYYGKYLRNRVVVQGPDPNYVVAVDTGTLATYGLREYADALKDAATANDLTAYTSHLRDTRKDISKYPTLVLRGQLINIFDPNVIQFGDLIKVTIADTNGDQNSYVQIDQKLRYKGAQVTVNKSGDETIVLYTQDLREL